MTDSNSSLYNKLVEAMSRVQRIAKSGFNNYHGYDYVREADLVEELRKILVDVGLALISSIEYQERNGDFTKVKVKFILIDRDTGERIESYYWGEGQDKGDKGLYKAYTGATKYYLMKTFLISTGDDPEADSEIDKENAGKVKRLKPREKELSQRESTVKKLIGEDINLKKEMYRYLHLIKQQSGVDKISLDDLTNKQYRELYQLLAKNSIKKAN